VRVVYPIEPNNCARYSQKPARFSVETWDRLRMELQVESLEHCARANNFDFAAWEAERGLRTVFGLFQLFLAELSVPHLQPFWHCEMQARIHCPLAAL
jgi:hypothetical protein